MQATPSSLAACAYSEEFIYATGWSLMCLRRKNGVNIVLSIAAFLPIAEVSVWLAQIRQVSGLHCMGASGWQCVAGAAVLPTVAADAPGAVMGPGACALELWRRLSRRAMVAQPT